MIDKIIFVSATLMTWGLLTSLVAPAFVYATWWAAVPLGVFAGGAAVLCTVILYGVIFKWRTK